MNQYKYNNQYIDNLLENDSENNSENDLKDNSENDYETSNDILNIKYRRYFKKRALQRANDYMYNNQLYGNRKWN